MSGLGTTLLLAALALAGVAGAAWAVSARHGEHSRAARVGRATSIASAVSVFAALGLIQVALLRHDTSVAYVQRVSGPDLPVYYQVTSLWSAVEGSLLLWLATLSLVVLLALRSVRKVGGPVLRSAAAVLNLVVVAFVVTSLIASPFAPAQAAMSGRPSPLLQDHVAMGMHPPLLYGGFAALAVPYALSIGALVARRIDHTWANLVRGWNLGAWILLTAGILLGSWWSYAVLGWGGYWAWDPVENASLMPWLTATALLHAVGWRTRVGNWRLWGVALAGASFVLVLLASFLTRSGLVESVHAFSISPLGPLMLAIVFAAGVPWVVLAINRRQILGPEKVTGRLDQHTAVQVNHVLLVLMTSIVFVGTILPTVIMSVTGDRLSVGPPWYHRTLAPVALVLLVVMAVAPWLRRRHTPPAELIGRIRVPLAGAALALGVVGLSLADLWLAVTSALAAFVLVSLVITIAGRAGARRRPDRRTIGALVAHLGVAGGAVAVLAGSYATTSEAALEVGQTLTAEDTSVTLVDVGAWDEGRRSVVQAELVLGQQGTYLGTVHPQLRWYEQDATMLAGPQMRSEPLRDVYVTLLDFEPEEGLATIRLTLTPLVSWMWAAGGLIVLGGVISAWPRRRGGRSRTERAEADVRTAGFTVGEPDSESAVSNPDRAATLRSEPTRESAPALRSESIAESAMTTTGEREPVKARVRR